MRWLVVSMVGLMLRAASVGAGGDEDPSLRSAGGAG